MKPTPAITALLTALFMGCLGGSDTPAPATAGEGFRFGTSFGMCAGYCRNEIEARPGTLIFRAWSTGRGEPLPDIETQSALPEDEWKALLAAFNAGAFNSLDTLIGCPDCADGGAEWVSVETGAARKVTYEFGKDLRGLEAFQDLLRRLLAKARGNAIPG